MFPVFPAAFDCRRGPTSLQFIDRMDIPFLGSSVIAIILVSAAYAFAMSLGAARGRPQLLAAARCEVDIAGVLFPVRARVA